MPALWTQSDIDALKIAVASGIQSVSYAGPPARTVVYASLAEMRSLLAAMQQDVAAAAGTDTYRLAQFDKGL